ncbi:MAG: endonuclease/exonuclease/phosphatase family protein [Clostridia bacterium]|nr:endonuclease/exonuclease/phosphatase family protein [Clostridia bacterium]
MTVRIFTSNVWADVFGNPVHPRDKLLAELVKKYSPDVICLQEMHPNWHKSDLKPCLSAMGYRESLPDLKGNPINFTPVFFRASRFAETDCGFLLYSGLNDYQSKSVSYSLLTAADEDGRPFTVCAMSTHFYFAQDPQGEAARLSNARELIDLIDSVKGADAFFCGGDYNCDVHSKPFALLASRGINSASLADCPKTDFVRTDHKNPVYDAGGGLYIPAKMSDEPNDRSIDHITCRGKARIVSYRVITDPEAGIISDHCPVLTDAEIM